MGATGAMGLLALRGFGATVRHEIRMGGIHDIERLHFGFALY
jgi:hypothetical protein